MDQSGTLAFADAVQAAPVGEPVTSAGVTAAIPERLRGPLVRHIVDYGLLRRSALHDALAVRIQEVGGRPLGERASRTGFEIMQFLCACSFTGTPPAISDVYLSTGLSKSTAIRTLATLERLGVVEKRPDVADRRRLLIHFTPPFEEVLKQFAADCLDELKDLMGLGDDADRRRTEDALRANEQRFRDFAQMSSDWFWESGPEHRFNWFSEGHRARLGMIADAFAGKTRWEVASDLNEQEKWAAHRADLEARRPFRRFRYALRIDTGENRVVEANGVPLFDEDERFLGYRGTAVDVTDRVLGETALRESEARLRRAVIGAPIPIMIHDENGDVLMISNRWTQITGYGASEIPTIHAWLSRAFTDDAGPAEEAMRALFESERPAEEGEFRVLTAGGETRRWEFHSSPLGELPSGRRIAITMAIDVTERRAAEAAMAQARDQADRANRSKSRFIQRLSHQLRMPLNTLIGFSQMMMAEQFGPLGAPNYRTYTADINQTGKHLLETINDVVDLAQLDETGRITFEETVVAAGTVVDHACREMAATAEAAGVRLVTGFGADVPALFADERRLCQVLMALLRNSLAALPEGGEIRIHTEATSSGDGVEIAITDSGHEDGAENRDLELALKPFWLGAVEPIGPDGHDRTGDFALPLACSLVELHDGSLEIEPVADGGIRICIRLPSAEARNAPCAPARATAGG